MPLLGRETRRGRSWGGGVGLALFEPDGGRTWTILEQQEWQRDVGLTPLWSWKGGVGLAPSRGGWGGMDLAPSWNWKASWGTASPKAGGEVWDGAPS